MLENSMKVQNKELIVISSDSDGSFDYVKPRKRDYHRETETIRKNRNNKRNNDNFVDGEINYKAAPCYLPSTLWSFEDDMELVDFALRNMKSSEPGLRFMKVTIKIDKIDLHRFIVFSLNFQKKTYLNLLSDLQTYATEGEIQIKTFKNAQKSFTEIKSSFASKEILLFGVTLL